jgi:hypothetical protein
MPDQSRKPYWVDELGRKHEGFPYGDSDTEVVSVKVQGQLLRLLVPKYTPPVEVTATASSGDLLFLIGKQLDKECEDGYVIEGGDGILMVARREKELDNTYWLAVCHNLFPQALQCLVTAE